MRATRGLRGSVVAFVFVVQALFSMNASASHAIPVSTTFTATGSLTIESFGAYIPCTTNMVLTTDAVGHAQITQMTFNSAPCVAFETQGFPWPVTFSGSAVGVVSNATLLSPFGNCIGNFQVNFWSSTMQFSGTWGPCGVSGTLTILPYFSVVTP